MGCRSSGLQPGSLACVSVPAARSCGSDCALWMPEGGKRAPGPSAALPLRPIRLLKELLLRPRGVLVKAAPLIDFRVPYYVARTGEKRGKKPRALALGATSGFFRSWSWHPEMQDNVIIGEIGSQAKWEKAPLCFRRGEGEGNFLTLLGCWCQHT